MDKEIMSSDKVAMLEEFERRKKVKAINVSTSDSEVKEDLRKLGEPICLFGEGPADRRNRLRELLGRLGEDVIEDSRSTKFEILAPVILSKSEAIHSVWS